MLKAYKVPDFVQAAEDWLGKTANHRQGTSVWWFLEAERLLSSKAVANNDCQVKTLLDIE